MKTRFQHKSITNTNTNKYAFITTIPKNVILFLIDAIFAWLLNTTVRRKWKQRDLIISVNKTITIIGTYALERVSL